MNRLKKLQQARERRERMQKIRDEAAGAAAEECTHVVVELNLWERMTLIGGPLSIGQGSLREARRRARLVRRLAPTAEERAAFEIREPLEGHYLWPSARTAEIQLTEAEPQEMSVEMHELVRDAYRVLIERDAVAGDAASVALLERFFTEDELDTIERELEEDAHA